MIRITCLALILLPLALFGEKLPLTSVFSEEPAKRWEDAMVSGNGLTGLMQFGDPFSEQYIFNDHRLLVPNGAPFEIPDMSDMVDPMRDLMLAGEIGEGWKLYHLELLKRQGFDIENLKGNYSGMLWSQSFHPGYILKEETSKKETVRNYLRYTDFRTGEIVTRWETKEGKWERRSFSSRADNLIITRTIAPPKAQINCSLSAHPCDKHPENIEYQTLADPRFISFRAKYAPIEGSPDQGGYEGVTRIIAVAGKTQVEDDSVRVSGARELILLTRLDRDRNSYRFWDKNKLQTGLAQIDPDYEQLLKRHTDIHQELFERVTFSLNAPFEHLNSSALLAREEADTDTVDLLLLEKLFYTSRYLFISSCGAEYGPRLSGIFLGAWGAAWAGDYTMDANANLAVLGGGIGNLPECMEGYFSLVERSLPQWRQAAKQFYGSRGILGPVRIDGEVGIPLHVSSYHAHMTATGLGPWILYPFYEHYQITGDLEFARKRLYPLLKEQALFYEDFLARTDRDGNYIFVPSNSPENAWAGVQPRTSASINATMDIAACKHLLRMLQRVEEDLEIHGNQEKWANMLAKMPPYLVNGDGALQEWALAGHGENYSHRHSSHVYTVWPAYEINPDSPSTRAYVPTVSKAIDMRDHPIIQSHDGLQRAIARLRIKEAEPFYSYLKHFLENRYFFDSFASSHDANQHIYNYDLILTLQGLLIEMAVFSDEAIVELLPALPKSFKTGSIQGVKTRNRCEVSDLSWDLETGRITCELRSEIDQNLTLVLRRGFSEIQTSAPTAPSPLGDFARIVTMPANESISVTFNIQKNYAKTRD